MAFVWKVERVHSVGYTVWSVRESEPGCVQSEREVVSVQWCVCELVCAVCTVAAEPGGRVCAAERRRAVLGAPPHPAPHIPSFPLPAPPPFLSQPSPPLPAQLGLRQRAGAAPPRPSLCGRRQASGGRAGLASGPEARRSRRGGRGHVQDVVQGERRGLREGAPGGRTAELRRRGRPPSSAWNLRGPAGWGGRRPGALGGRCVVGSGRAGVAPVVCGLVVRASPERLSILLTADTVSSAAGPGAAGKVTGGRSGGGGEEALGRRSPAAAPRRNWGCCTDSRSCVLVPERQPHHCRCLPRVLF